MIIYSLTGIPHSYVYEKDRDYKALQDRFLHNTYKALDHLYAINALTISYRDKETPVIKQVIRLLIADTAHVIKIQYSETKNYHKSATQTIGFYDTHGIYFKLDYRERWSPNNRGYNSPMTLLAHELLHCYHAKYRKSEYLKRKKNHSPRKKIIDPTGHDLSFPNLEEVFVVTIINALAKQLGEGMRSNYGRSYYEVEDVTSFHKKVKIEGA